MTTSSRQLTAGPYPGVISAAERQQGRKAVGYVAS